MHNGIRIVLLSIAGMSLVLGLTMSFVVAYTFLVFVVVLAAAGTFLVEQGKPRHETVRRFGDRR